MKYLLKAKKQLIKEPILGSVIKNTKLTIIPQRKNVYPALLRAIIGQQLSVKVADTIYSRFVGHFETDKPEAQLLLETSEENLRNLGLSRQKANYVKNVAEFFIDKKSFTFAELTDKEVMDLLVSIKGVGEWTVQMILIFTLNRPDIFPVKDLAIQKQMTLLFGLKNKKRKLLLEMEEKAKIWKPFRSVAARYLWAAENSNG